MNTIIIENKGNRWLSQFAEFKEDLPDNVFLNKITTGSGMTSLALTTKKKYIICVPFKELIKNKLGWCKLHNISAIGVYDIDEGGATNKELSQFKGDKIFTTWDSLERVMKFINPLDWKILVDEAHQLVQSGNFRTEAVDFVLDMYTKFGSFIFGTATPVRYQHPALKDVQRMEIKWDNLEKVSILYTQYEKELNKAVAVLCSDYLSGNHKANNAHIFINSVKSIADILKHMKSGGKSIDSENIRIVCADNERNREIIKNKLNDKFPISSISSEVRKINFYTATAFEGCDIYDENGQIYIISDGQKDHTKIDILTTLPQIIGRIRNQTHRNVIHMWYTPNKYYSHTTEDQFKYIVAMELEKAKKLVDTFEIIEEEVVKATLIKGSEDNSFIIVRDGKMKVNSTAWYAELNAFHTINQSYYVNKNVETNKTSVKNEISEIKVNTIDYLYTEEEKLEIKGLNKIKLGKKANFSELCKKYFELMENKNEIDADKIASVEPIIKEAFLLIGSEKMIALKLQKSNIQQEIIKLNSIKSNDWKIVNLLNLRVGEWIAKSELKDKIQKIYDDLGINSTAKATDIGKWYIVSDRSKRIDNVNTQGFVINLHKFKK